MLRSMFADDVCRSRDPITFGFGRVDDERIPPSRGVAISKGVCFAPGLGNKHAVRPKGARHIEREAGGYE